jgi:hypothetical protein
LVRFTRDGSSTDTINVDGRTADSLLHDLPLPFRPPGIGHALEPSAFTHWWKQLCYVFDLPDPRETPQLPVPLTADELEAASRFVEMSDNLATSALLNSASSITVQPSSFGDDTVTMVNFPPFDIQAGFATTLRHSDDPNELASYSRVKNSLAVACQRASDTQATRRGRAVTEWGRAVKCLHRKSLEQLLRERLVSEEGLSGFDFEELYPPRQLLQMFNYGDLIHWTQAETVRTDGPAFLAKWQRFEFFLAAAGLAHIYIGFGELTRAILGLSQPDAAAG